MDLVLSDHRATDAEREAIASVLGDELDAWRGGDDRQRHLHTATGGQRQRGIRHRLLPTLHAVNDRVGWISRGAINEIARRLDVAPAEIYGVATFYGLFSTTERAAHQVHVCVDLACLGQVVPDGAHPSACLGLCERAPAAMTIDAGVDRKVTVWPSAPASDAVPQAGDPSLVLLRRAGVVDPTSIDSYLAHGGFNALEAARTRGAAEVIAQVTASGLAGRGGAAFPTGRKWAAVAAHDSRPRYLVVNADESEPGTFKDRVLMENDPFSIVEAAIIAMEATRCTQGFIYLRGEYPLARTLLEGAIAQCVARGYLDNAERLSVFLGAGAYICGEETAIFNSIEGYRGEPRSKPPFPVDAGLWGCPTLVNNVETLVNVLPIVLDGAEAYRARGTDGSPGTKLFCVSGSVARPGVYEVSFGVTLRQLLDLCGGVVTGRELRAVLLGGAAGGFATADDLDVPLTFEGTRAAGLTLGSGVVMVIDDQVDLGAVVRRIAEFFRDESCGQCVPCRVGTVRQHELLERHAGRAPLAHDAVLLADIAQVMRDASICGLGQTAANAIESAVRKLGVLS
jgi:NADH-quinone oxidoreductase subunit F